MLAIVFTTAILPFWSVSEPWHLLSPLFGKNFPGLDGGKKGEREGRKKRKKERRKEINFIALLILKSAQISEMLIRNASPEYPVWNSIHMTIAVSSSASHLLWIYFSSQYMSLSTLYIVCLIRVEHLFYSLLCVQHLQQHLAHSSCICWMNEWINEQQQQSHFDITLGKHL